MDTEGKKQVDISASFPSVKEADTCPFWEFSGEESLIPMCECWYCKYSDFRKNVSEHKAYGLCSCPKNQIH